MLGALKVLGFRSNQPPEIGWRMHERVPSTNKEQQVCSHSETNLLDLNSFSRVESSFSVNLDTLGTPAFQFCWIQNDLQQSNKGKQSIREYCQSERQKTQRKHYQLCQYKKRDLIPWEVLPNVPAFFALWRTEDQLHSPEPQQYAWEHSWQRQTAGLAVCAAVFPSLVFSSQVQAIQEVSGVPWW